MPTVRVNDAELYYESIGHGPPILMMHGNGVDHTYLRPYHDALADQARVIYYDHRWHGRSERTGPADHATWHADAAGLLDVFSEPRAIIYGHSYGAWLALGFAARYPERVAGLILSGASPAFDYPAEVVANALARDPAVAQVLIDAFSSAPADDATLEATWRAVLPLYFHGPARPEMMANVRFSAAGYAPSSLALEGFTMMERLPKLDTPILVLAGRHDFITPLGQAHRLAAAAPHATVVELSESGHFPFVEETDAYLAAIRAWLK